MLARWRAGPSLAEALNAEALNVAAAPRFVPQAALPSGEGYEAFIRRSGQVPTRDHLHDFFNGLVWLQRPALKARLNAWHGLEARRGPLRDALTLLDENGALLHGAPPPLLAALVARDWRRLFIELRPLWRELRLELVGHALLEKLVQPRKPICAHVLLSEPAEPGGLAAKPFHPLPVLGVPGWWAPNAAPGFYDDAAVFRPRRVLQTG